MMSSYAVRRWILDRLSEKGTWGALASFAGLFGLVVTPDQLGLIGGAVIAIVNFSGLVRKGN